MLLDEKELLTWLSQLTREEWHRLDAAMLMVWRKRFEGTELFPVRL